MPHRSLGGVLALTFLLCLKAFAQGGSGLYLGPGRVLEAAAPRQLSLNAHVTGFLPQPGGLSIAYVGVRNEAGGRTVTVCFADARGKDPTTTLFVANGNAPDALKTDPQVPGVDLLGWTPDARYLLLRQEDEITGRAHYVSVDVGAMPFRARTVPTPQTPGDGQAVSCAAWSPDHRRLLVTADGVPAAGQDAAARVTAAEIYDPAHDDVSPVTVADGVIVWGWLDAGHLLLLRRSPSPDTKTVYLTHDLAAGTDAEITKPAPWPPASGSELSAWASSPDPVTSAAPGLTLETQRQTLTDAQKVAGAPVRSLWVRRAGAPKALSAIPVGVTPGPDDPQAAWSPGGMAVVYIAHGDLFVADLVARAATPYEKVAAGEKLDCDEERAIITSNLKQVGLGLLQYIQDNDEKFPPAGGWHDAVYPYIKNERVFNFAGVPIVYHAPPGMTLASIESPAETVLATSDTPCARVVLFADGHVKDYDKEGKLFPPGPKQ